ncbi:hypothetical protein NFI95_06910 [Acetobacteraceae bacterium KSS8]|uniref:Uncharacterized protein n=1 Tax=Endosaccharibacter trunci TaxID=2812733 RepID=A0ABT1W7R8_9PROT|nr:hypothetical protein [Acetobacteraceae bacterium KSS8]
MTIRAGTVQPVLRTLWRRSVSGTEAPPIGPGEDSPETLPVLSRSFGETAMACVSASIRADRDALVGKSADLFEHLFEIWAAFGLDPREVWVELHKREQLGTLLMQLNLAQNQLPRRVLKPWRVDSTKLP